jgi:DNA modification methylase
MIHNGDCLEIMKSIPDKSVDLIICDLPYGEISCKWDTPIDLELFWKEIKRIRKIEQELGIKFYQIKQK